MTISVFGNPIVEKDALLVKMLPKLCEEFPEHRFVYQDPTEDLVIPEDEWWILDMAEGINQIMIFETLDHFQRSKSVSVHGYDLYLELSLQEKLGQLPDIKIVAVPIEMGAGDVLDELKAIFTPHPS